MMTRSDEPDRASRQRMTKHISRNIRTLRRTRERVALYEEAGRPGTTLMSLTQEGREVREPRHALEVIHTTAKD